MLLTISVRPLTRGCASKSSPRDACPSRSRASPSMCAPGRTPHWRLTMPAAANPPLLARADLASFPCTSCSIKRAWKARRCSPFIGARIYYRPDRGDYPTVRPGISRSVAGRTRSCTCWRDGCRSAERFVDLLDRTAACFKADEPEGKGPENVPESEVVEARDQRIERRLRLDVVGRAGDQRQPRRADELAEIADAVDKSHAAAAQPPRPQLAHVGTDDRIIAATEEALQQQHDVKHRHAGYEDAVHIAGERHEHCRGQTAEHTRGAAPPRVRNPRAQKTPGNRHQRNPDAQRGGLGWRHLQDHHE